jgi:hypothetical protein
MAKEKRIPSQTDRTTNVGKYVAALEKLRRHNTLALREVISRVIEDFASDDALTHQEKVTTLLQIKTDLSNHLTKLVSKAPAQAPSTWATRNRSNQETPIDFVRRVYVESLGHGLTQSDIRRLDYDLYRALQNWKQRYGWPSDFMLPTKQSKNEMLLSSYDPSDNRFSTGDAALAALNSEARLFEAARNRVRKKKRNAKAG